MANDQFDLDQALKFISEHGRKSSKIPKAKLKKTAVEKYLDALKAQEQKFRDALAVDKNPKQFDKTTSWVQWAGENKVYSVRACSPAFPIHSGLLYVSAKSTDEVLYLFEVFRRLAESGDPTFTAGIIRKYGTVEEKSQIRVTAPRLRRKPLETGEPRVKRKYTKKPKTP